MKSNSAILRHKGKNYSLHEINVIGLNLSDFERRIINARIDGVSFSQIEQDNVRWHIDQLMLRGAAICGCKLPSTEFFAEIIADELTELIVNFGYSELTYLELLLAMRINAKGGFKFPSGLDLETISFFGNSFNVDYYSKVLNNYMTIRNLLDRKLQNFIDGY